MAGPAAYVDAEQLRAALDELLALQVQAEQEEADSAENNEARTEAEEGPDQDQLWRWESSDLVTSSSFLPAAAGQRRAFFCFATCLQFWPCRGCSPGSVDGFMRGQGSL